MISTALASVYNASCALERVMSARLSQSHSTVSPSDAITSTAQNARESVPKVLIENCVQNWI